MKTKLTRWIGAVFMVLLFLILGMPDQMVHAQINTTDAERISDAWQSGNREFSSFDDDKALKVDSGYGFKLKTTDKTKTVVVKGTSTNSLPDISMPAFLKAYTWFHTGKNSEENIQIKKTNMEIYQCQADGSKGRWEKVDLVMTVTNFEKYNGEDGYIAIGNGVCGSAYIGIEEMTMESRFYKAGTSTAITLKSNVTLKDIDTRQYIGIKADKIHGQYVSKSTRLSYKTSNGMNIYYADFDSDYDSQDFTCAGFTFESDHFEYTFGRVKEDGPSGQEQYVGSGQNMVRFNTPNPKKTVCDDNEDKVLANTVESLSKPWTYEVEQPIASGIPPSHYYKNFMFKDSIESCLDILEINVIGDDEDVTEKFDITKNGNNITATLKNPKDADFYTRGVYTLRISVKMKIPENPSEQQMQQLKDIWASHGHYNAEKTVIFFENQAQTIVDEHTAPSNKAETIIELPTEDEAAKSPGLKVTKETEYYEYQAKDLISYTVSVKNTNPKADTSYVLIEDESLPNTTLLQYNSIKVSGIDEKDYTLKKTENGWQLQSKGDYSLPYENTIKITYDVLAKKEANGSLIDNEASVKALGVPEKKDQKQVYINSPKNNVIKTAPDKAYKIGDNITYTVKVTNPNPGTFMRNLYLEDELKADGMKLVPGSLAVLSGRKDITADCEISYGKDGRSYSIQTDMELSQGIIPAIESPWGKQTGDYKNLQLTEELQVVYQMVVESDQLEGMNLKNVFQAPATKNSRGDQIKDDTEIPSGGGWAEEYVKIKSPSLQIVKTSDKQQYQVGETGTYTLHVTQEKEDLIAKNVIIMDCFKEEGMEISKIAISYNGEDITKECKITASQNKFQIETGRNLGEQDRLKITYDVFFREKTEGNVVNTAVAKADNTLEDQDEHMVILENPTLSVQKSSDKKVYHVGEIGTYQLKVTQNSKGLIAKNVVIEDCFERSGMKISNIQVKYNDKDITSECTIVTGEKENEFRIATGRNLKESEELLITYKVFFQTMLEGDVTNGAIALSDNTDPGSDENTIRMQEAVPKLSIVKTSDKKKYKTGEKGTYKVVVTEMVKDAIAKQMIITDKISEKGAVILKDTIKIKDSSGKNITSQCKITCNGKSYRIETGKTLAYDQHMTVTYQVHFKEKSLEGKKLLNIAVVKGANAKEVSVRYQVTVKRQASTGNTSGGTGGDVPKTGDSFSVLWLFVSVGAAACLVFCARKRYNRKK